MSVVLPELFIERPPFRALLRSDGEIAIIDDRKPLGQTSMTDRYMRAAGVLRGDRFGRPFPPLPERLLEAPQLSGNCLAPSSERQVLDITAGRTGLEPAASGVTGRRYNQLNYRPKRTETVKHESVARRRREPPAPPRDEKVGGTGIEPATSGL